MAVSRLPSGRYRVQLYQAGKLVSIAKVPGLLQALDLTDATFANPRAARSAESKAYEWLEKTSSRGVTVSEWCEKWLTSPLWKRPKESTRIHYRERTRRFVEKYGALPLAAVSDSIVAEWIDDGKNMTTVPVLKTMWKDASSAKAGRIVAVNPWLDIKVEKGSRAEEDIPSEELVREVIRAARTHAPPTFAAWLQVGAFTGMRPGELDGLRWSNVNFGAGVIRVVEQYNAKSRNFTLPKNGRTRDAVLTPPAREALMGVPQDSEFCFTTLRGSHWTASARAYHWKGVRAATSYTGDFYEAGRHFAGWYMTNVLDLDAELVAIALGHTDGGYLVRTLYGHRDKKKALDSVRDAYARQGNVVPLSVVREEGA